jgi:PKD repeat protein
MGDRVRRVLLVFAALSVAVLRAESVSAQGIPRSFPNGPNPHAVATFHSIGLYWYDPSGGATAKVQFREQGSADWRSGLDLWYDTRNSEYRGSLVELRPGTTYDVQITRNNVVVAQLTGAQAPKTWSETFDVPANYTITVPPGTTRIVINPTSSATPSMSGTGTVTISAPRGSDTGPKSFTRITASQGQKIVSSETAADNACIVVNHGTRRVLIGGLILEGCKRWGVEFTGGTTGPNTEDIVIDNNEFVGWGRLGGDDGAIHCNFSAPVKPQRVVIQRNTFRDPRYSSNPWGPNEPGNHPAGPHALYFSRCGGNHVFRYNDVHANGNGHHFNDGVGGCCNNELAGAPGDDSDIYGNRISHVYDDAIESEGGNRNVRIWANYIDRSLVAIANAATVAGPLYVWRNVSNDMALMRDPAAPNEGVSSRGPFVKGGSDKAPVFGGRTYYFHNTVLQPPSQQSGQPYPRGAGYGILNSGDGQLYNFVSRNNIWQIHRVPDAPGNDFRSIMADCDLGPCSADYDLFNGQIINASNPGAPEVNAIKLGLGGNVTTGDESKVPTYASSGTAYPSGTIPSPSNGWTGDFRLSSSSLGYGRAELLPNFNDQFENPDVGAHQSGPGTAPKKYGVAAAATTTPPHAQMTVAPISGSAKLIVSFDAGSSTPGSAPIASYVINFGDGTPNGTGAQQSHTYTNAGTYVATLTVTDANQASDTYSQTIQVDSGTPPPPPPPSAAFEMNVSGNPGLEVNRAAGEGIVFTASASDGRALQSIRFYYDGVLKLTDTTAPYQYSWTSTASDNIGNHTITVEATDTAGTVMRETRSVTILPAACGIFPSASSLVQGETLSVQSMCSAWVNPQRVDLTIDNFIIRRDAARPYTWVVDTGALSVGSHAVGVTGILGPGQQSSDSVNIQVLPAPLVLNISPGPVVVLGETVNFTAAAADGRAFRQVDFYLDGYFRQGQNVAPFEWIWNGSEGARVDAFGRHTLVVQGTDLNGNVLSAKRELYALTQACNALADTSRYQVGAHDTVATGAIAVRQGEILTVHGVCSATRNVQRVQFFVDGVSLGNDAIAPYGWPVATSGLAVGQHTLSIKGVFADGTESNHAISFEVAAP